MRAAVFATFMLSMILSRAHAGGPAKARTRVTTQSFSLNTRADKLSDGSTKIATDPRVSDQHRVVIGARHIARGRGNHPLSRFDRAGHYGRDGQWMANAMKDDVHFLRTEAEVVATVVRRPGQKPYLVSRTKDPETGKASYRVVRGEWLGMGAAARPVDRTTITVMGKGAWAEGQFGPTGQDGAYLNETMVRLDATKGRK